MIQLHAVKRKTQQLPVFAAAVQLTRAATCAIFLLCFQRPQIERLLLSRGKHSYVEAHRHGRHRLQENGWLHPIHEGEGFRLRQGMDVKGTGRTMHIWS